MKKSIYYSESIKIGETESVEVDLFYSKEDDSVRVDINETMDLSCLEQLGKDISKFVSTIKKDIGKDGK